VRKLSLISTIVLAVFTAQTSGYPRQTSQERPPRFGVEVNFIEVDALVVDGNGNFVSNLRLEDFEILEDGVPQEIATFRLVDIPVTPVPVTVEPKPFAAADVRTNEAPEEGRIFVLVLDDLHTSSERSTIVQRVAREFIEKWMVEGDWVAITNTSGTANASHGFTDNRLSLLESIDKFMGRKLKPLYAERIEVLEQVQQGMEPDIATLQMKSVEQEHGHRAQTAMNHLQSVASGLSNIQGRRKSIVFVSEGIAYDIHDFMNTTSADAIVNGVQQAIGSAGFSNVAFYTLDVRGLGAGQGGSIVSSQSAASLAQNAPQPSAGGRNPRYRDWEILLEEGSRGVRSLQEEVQRSKDSLRILSNETGGVAVVNENDLGEGLHRIVDDSSHYYLLGYYPTHDLAAGKFRRIEVRVKRPELTVRARKGYAPSKAADVEARGTKPLEDVLTSALPVPGIPLRIFAAPLELDRKKVSVAVVVEITIDGFRFTEKNGRIHDKVDIAFLVLDERGEAVESLTRGFDLTIRPEIRELLLKDGFRTMTVLELRPGTYRLRVGVHENGAGFTGSVHYDLEVPKQADDEPVMSGLFLTSRMNSEVPVAARDEDRKRVPVIPTTRRRFAPDDEITIYAETYKPKKKSAQTELTVETQIRRAGGEVVYESRASADIKESSSKRLVYESRLDLSTLPPGQYILELLARDADGTPRAKRTTTFGTSVTSTVMEPILFGLPAYRDLVTMYSDGLYEVARQRLSEWPPEEAESAVKAWLDTQLDDQSLLTATLLHTETVLFPKDDMTETAIDQQLQLSKELIDSVQDESKRLSFHRDWLLGLVYYFHGANLSRSLDYLKQGARDFPDDARILLAQGVTRESMAARYDNYEGFVDAEELYRAALEIDPELGEAHLRLGIVLADYGAEYEQEAMDQLKWVVAHSDDSYLLYLAHIFLGDLHRRELRFEEAAEAYRSAIKVQPEWRTAYVWLSQVLFNAGDLDGATQVESETPVGNTDVYSLYNLGQLRELPEQLERLRRQAMH
jgi:VWFA-related protein